MKKIALFVLLVTSLASCSKDDDEPEVLYGWTFDGSSYTADETSRNATNTMLTARNNSINATVNVFFKQIPASSKTFEIVDHGPDSNQVYVTFTRGGYTYSSIILRDSLGVQLYHDSATVRVNDGKLFISAPGIDIASSATVPPDTLSASLNLKEK